MKKYATGIRFMKGFDFIDGEIDRVDILICKVLKEGAKEIKMHPEEQFNFSFHPESVTPKQIAHCFRSLAYKIQRLEKL